MFAVTRKALQGCLAAALLVASAAQAAIVTIAGDDLLFTYDDSTLYGAAIVVGNSITFNPTGFQALATNGGIDFENETLNIEVRVKAGSDFRIANIGVREEGDYKLLGAGSYVSVEGQLGVTSLTRTTGSPPFPFHASTVFDAGSLAVLGPLTPWSAEAAIALGDIAGWGSDSHLLVTIQNDLTALAAAGGLAMAEKKFQGVGLVVSEVPVPAAAWLFASALPLLYRRRARR